MYKLFCWARNQFWCTTTEVDAIGLCVIDALCMDVLLRQRAFMPKNRAENKNTFCCRCCLYIYKPQQQKKKIQWRQTAAKVTSGRHDGVHSILAEPVWKPALPVAKVYKRIKRVCVWVCVCTLCMYACGIIIALLWGKSSIRNATAT